MLYSSNNVRGSPDGGHERRACTLEAYVLRLAIAILAIVALVCVVLLILHHRKRRQEERRQERVKQEAVLRLIEQVEVTDDDAVLDELFSQFVFGYEADPDRWKCAKQKAAGARMRMEQALADEELGRLLARGEEGRSLEVYARELVDYTELKLSGEGKQMLAAERIRVADMFVDLLLEQARDGSAQALIKLRSVVSHDGSLYTDSFYMRLTGKAWQPPQDWNALVAHRVWRPDSTRWFYYENVQRKVRDVRNWVAAVTSTAHGLLPHERSVQTLMLLALVDASGTDQWQHGIVGHPTWVPQYRRELGDVLYARLVGLAQELRPIESVGL